MSYNDAGLLAEIKYSLKPVSISLLIISFQVLWFGVSKNSPCENNKHGNVSFTLSIERIMKKFGSKFLYLDQTYNRSHTTTRMVLAKSDGDLESELQVVDHSDRGSGLMSNSSGMHHATKCLNRLGYPLPHEVEVAIEVYPEDCSWLYHQCTVEANDHSLANARQLSLWRYDPNVCHQYNNYDRYCSYKYDWKLAKDYLEIKFPNY